MPRKRPDIRLVDAPAPAATPPAPRDREAPPPQGRAAWSARVRAAQRGDVAAFEQLVREHQGAVYAFAVTQLSDPTEARDAAQEALVKAYRRLDSYRFAAPFRTWLLQITRNACLDRLRQRRAQREGLRRYTVGREQQEPPPDPERSARAREATERIHQALSRIDPVFREVVVLFDLQGHSYQEIASICGVPLATVKSRLGRGREALRQAVLELAESDRREEEAP